MFPQQDIFKSASVPIAEADCRYCADPCDQDHDELTVDIDRVTELLGSVKPYRRQVLISTGKSNWPHEVTEVEGTLAHLLSLTEDERRTADSSPSRTPAADADARTPPGLFASDPAHRLSILNGSHAALSGAGDAVVVLPDYTVVADVPRSRAGAEALWHAALAPARAVPRGPPRAPWGAGAETALDWWVLPYSCLVLLCSHRGRDKRCGIAAPMLRKAFVQHLEHRGWEVHTALHDRSWYPPRSPLLPPPTNGARADGDDGGRAAYEAELRALPGDRRALILFSSHIGQHKFAGNVIIYTPGGASVWYGRVTPHHVESIVENTIIGGRVLLPLLRGGLNLSRPGCETLNDW